MRPALALPALLSFLLLSQAGWAGSLIEISAEASRPAANDLVRATLFAESSGPTPKHLSAKINTLMAEALRISKGQGGIKAQSGDTRTYPVYGRNGQIESWRMRSELVLESRDADRISEVVGRLQENLGVASLQFMPAPETQKQAEAQAIRDAIAAFQARADLVGETLGKSYRIKQMSINTSGMHRPPVLYRKAAPMMAEAAAPMPMEAGESDVQVQVSGQIELAD